MCSLVSNWFGKRKWELVATECDENGLRMWWFSAVHSDGADFHCDL